MSPVVDAERLTRALQALQRHWERSQAPILDYLNPGISDDEIDAVLAPLGWSHIPVEVRVWFRWHDGCRYPSPDERPWGDWTVGASSYHLLSTARAVELTKEMREHDRRMSEEEWEVCLPGDVWHPSWLALAKDLGEDTLVVSGDVPPGHPTPARHWDTESWARESRTSSLTEVVETWVKILDDGLIVYDGDRWVHTVSSIDPDLRRPACYPY